jgi:arylformamidase
MDPTGLLTEDLDWIDVSAPIKTGMVHWPGDPTVRIERFLDMERGDEANVSRIMMGSHTGTHMDGPVHFVKSGQGIDALPLSTAIGRARVIEIRDPKVVNPGELIEHKIERGERILFKTENSARCRRMDTFVEEFVHLSGEAAQYLVDKEVGLVGIDYLSVDSYKSEDFPAHRILLGAGVWIIEGLDLSQAGQGACILVCLPLKIVGGDGAPARVVLGAVRPGEAG